MKLLTKLTFLFLFPSIVMAGVSGGGGGPRPVMNFTVNTSNMEHSILEGGSQVGTLFTSDEKNAMDFVKTVGFDNSGKVLFEYKGFDSSKVEIYSVDVNDFAPNYLESLKKSQRSKDWEPVVLEGLGI